MDTTTRTVTIQPVIHFDPQAPIVVDVPEGSTPESEFSRRRTALSGHRTGLSEHRTHLSEHRTELSEHRTQLSENRTTLSTLRSHLSNERTHLSYLRTAISLVGFGITLNRFAIYLIQNDRLAAGAGGLSALRDTKSVGLGMVVLGFALLAWSLFRFHRTARDIETHRYHTDWRAVWIVSGIFLLLGIATTLWLFLN
jgi:inner membrane protein YidH